MKTEYDKFQLILEATAKEYGVTKSDIKGKRRLRKFVNPRFTAVLLAYKRLTKLTEEEIGAMLGDRDHSTIINALRKARIYLETEDEFRFRHDRIYKELLPMLSRPVFQPKVPGLLLAKNHIKAVEGFM